MRWITVGLPGQPDTGVVLSPVAIPGVTDEETRVIESMMAKGTYAMLVLSTDDLDAAFARVKAAGAEVVQEPTDQPYGLRDCAIRDPAGTMIRINQS